MATKSKIWYEPNHSEFAKFIMSPQVQAPVLQVAEAVAEMAAFLAPFDPKGKGPHLRDEFEVSVGPPITIGGSPRVSAVVSNSNPAATANEFGTASVPRHRMLARAAARFGDFNPKDGVL